MPFDFEKYFFFLQRIGSRYYFIAGAVFFLFYVDFVILTKNKTTYLFDTKTKGSDPANAHLKHNALIDFIAERNAKGLKTIGGLLLPNEVNGNMMWKYCTNKIENTIDTKGWDNLDFNKN